jgi:hypothetical protein
MFESRQWLQIGQRYRYRPRLDPLDRVNPVARVSGIDKASVEIEAAVVLVAALAVAVIFEASSWHEDHQRMIQAFSMGTYLGALLSPDRSFCDRLEAWLQALLGVLLALTLFAIDGLTGWWLLLVVPAGLMTAILGNALQKMLWDLS